MPAAPRVAVSGVAVSRVAVRATLAAGLGLGFAAAALAGVAPARAAERPEKVAVVRDARITESSGLAASPTDPDVVWTVNDSGDSARAFAVSLRTGRTVAVLTERTDARDCEAMTSGRDATGRAFLVIGDIGDNRAVRDSVVLRVIREPDPVRSVTVTPVDLRVRYPGGPVDAETLIWTSDGRLLIVTKSLAGGTVLQVPAAAVRRALGGHSVETPARATKVGSVSQILPTDGVALPDGRLIVRDYAGATVYQRPRYDGNPLVAQARLSLPSQPQGETITAVDRGSAVLVGSEGVHQPLWRVAVPAADHSGASSGGSSGGSSSVPKSTEGQRDSHRMIGLVAAALAAGALVVLIALLRRSVGAWRRPRP